jgi:hypothetical protein
MDADGFGPIELPAGRAGLLTLSTFLTAGARPTGGSPVTRGLAVNGSILCHVNPPFPLMVDPATGVVGPDTGVTAVIASQAGKSELEQAQYRAATAECAVCHAEFDAFGMVLEPYDAVGRLRSVDLEGRPIDESWTTVELPESVGGGTVTSAKDFARVLVENGALERCMAINFIDYALMEVTQGGARDSAGHTSCAVRAVLDAFAQTDGSFGSLIAEIAASETLTVRAQGVSE